MIKGLFNTISEPRQQDGELNYHGRDHCDEGACQSDLSVAVCDGFCLQFSVVPVKSSKVQPVHGINSVLSPVSSPEWS